MQIALWAPTINCNPRDYRPQAAREAAGSTRGGERRGEARIRSQPFFCQELYPLCPKIVTVPVTSNGLWERRPGPKAQVPTSPNPTSPITV